MIAGGNAGTGNALNMANEEEQGAQQNQQFWNNVYSQFNPQAPVTKTPSSAPGYAQAAQNTNNYSKMLQGVAGGSGGTGKLDMGALQAGVNNTAGQISRSQDLNSYLSDLDKNFQASNQSQMGGWGRTQDIMGADRRLNELPQQRALENAKEADYMGNKWQQYLNEQSPWENLVGGAAGKLGGTIAGNWDDIFNGGTPQPPDPYDTGTLPSYGQVTLPGG